MSAPEHREHCAAHNKGRTMWFDDDGRVQGYRCICERRKGERRGSERRRYEVGYGHRLESDRRTTDRREADA